MQQRGTSLLDQLLDVAVPDERGELHAELPFPSPKIGYISHSGRKHVTFPQHRSGIPEKPFLGFTAQRGHVLGPTQQLQMAVVVAEAHQTGEVVEILSRLLVAPPGQVPQRHHVASGQSGQCGGFVRLHAGTRQPLLHDFRTERGHPDLLYAGENGGQKLLRRSRHQQKKRLVPRLLQNLQQTVRRLDAHLLRQPQHHRLVLRLERLEGELADDLVRLAFGDQPLLIVQPQPTVPLLLVEVPSRSMHGLSPLRQKGIAHGLLRTALGGVDRKDEVYVGMHQTGHLHARGTHAATVAVAAGRAVDILHIGERQRQSAPTAVARKELCMADAPLIDAPAQHRFHLLLPYDIRKLHLLSFVFRPLPALRQRAHRPPRGSATTFSEPTVPSIRNRPPREPYPKAPPSVPTPHARDGQPRSGRSARRA